MKRKKVDWHSLDDFTRAYVTAALWSTNDESDEQGGEPLDTNYDWDDIVWESQSTIIADCARFALLNLEALALIPKGREWSAMEQAGHDYWLTRNGHGAGFWDRDYSGLPFGETTLGEYLTAAAEARGEVDITVHRGKLYFSGGK